MANEHLNIVFADDEENDRLLFLDALKELKIKTNVHTVNDGIELMNYLNNSNNRLPHLLFLDLNMPKKNGMECLKEIRQIHHLQSLSIIILAATVIPTLLDELFTNGVLYYVKKPDSFEALTQIIQQVLSMPDEKNEFNAQGRIL